VAGRFGWSSGGYPPRQHQREEAGLDGISMLKDDHKKVRTLFRDAQKAGDNPGEQTRLAQQIVQELTVHSFVEESVFYPAVRREVPDAGDMVLESLEEHTIVKWVCAELAGLSPDDEHFDARLTVLREMVEHHVQEEEQELFPQVRKALGRKRLAALGDEMAVAKRQAPAPTSLPKPPAATAKRAGGRPRAGARA
jgi:hemerythrin superfamily protein